MTRHGRNATNAAVYTYHERKKDAAASGYGSDKMRLNKDSIAGFDCCSITLQPCRNPIVTSDGWIYDKEAVLKYILDKKEEYRKQLKVYESQTSQEFKTLAAEAEKDREKKRKAFEKSEQSILSTAKPSAASGGPSTSAAAAGSSSASTSHAKVGTSKGLPSFWVPNLTPQASTTKVKRPEKKIICPMSGKSLKMKNFTDVKFTEIKNSDEAKNKSIIAREERYCCAVTNDVLRNTTPCVVLKPTGDVVTVECVEKIIKKDMIHPLTGQKLQDEDLIYLQRGGTGYSNANDQLKASRYRPSSAIA